MELVDVRSRSSFGGDPLISAEPVGNKEIPFRVLFLGLPLLKGFRGWVLPQSVDQCVLVTLLRGSTCRSSSLQTLYAVEVLNLGRTLDAVI